MLSSSDHSLRHKHVYRWAGGQKIRCSDCGKTAPISMQEEALWSHVNIVEDRLYLAESALYELGMAPDDITKHWMRTEDSI